jgi:hypothetical protein
MCWFIFSSLRKLASTQQQDWKQELVLCAVETKRRAARVDEEACETFSSEADSNAACLSGC